MNLPTSSKNSPPQKPMFSEYVDAAKAGLARVWNNRWLWFWGIFLPMGGGMGFNFPAGNQGGNEEDAPTSPEEFFGQAEAFIGEYFVWIVAGAIVIIVINVLFWIISAIARSGVIQALAELQDPSKALTYNFKKVWKGGKKDVWRIIVLDILISVGVFLIMLVLITPIIFLVLNQNYIGAVFVGLLAILVLFPTVIIAGYIKQTSTVLLVLSKQKVFSAIERGYSILTKNLVPALKLLVVSFVLGIIHGLVVFVAIICLAIVGLFFGAMLWFSVGNFAEIFSDPGGNIGATAILGFFIFLLLLLFFACSLAAKAFFSLWLADIWLWWVKRVGGVQTGSNFILEEDPEEILEGKTVPTPNVSSKEN